MRTTLIDQTGKVTCPHCGAANSFTEHRTTAAKALLIPTIGIGTLLASKRLRCNGCGRSLRSSRQTRTVNGHGKSCVCKDCCNRRLG